MNDPSQHEFVDELLSAYLDDELSADERALVESRLATDPAARQALEQLRSVSQSVRNLPRENMNRDLRDSILRRAAAAKATTDPTATRAVRSAELVERPRTESLPSHAVSDTLPKLSIGRTTRGWVWASAAVAAAILIMVLQPGREQDSDLPNIARNSDKSATVDEKLAASSRELRDANEPAYADAVSASGAPPASAPMPQDVTDGRAAVAPSKMPDSFGVESQSDSSRLALERSAEVSEAKSGPPTAAPAAPAEAPRAGSGPSSDDDRLVVVHVLAKRAAFENKTFDQLLLKNRVHLEPMTSAGDATGSAGASSSREPASVVSGRLNQQPADEAKKDEADVDMVLVDAPSNTILSCMSDLNSDANNYLGVSVDDSSTQEDESLIEPAATKKLATNLEKFNRGSVPRQQAETSARDEYFFNYSADDIRRFSGGQELGGGIGGFGRATQDASQSLSDEGEVDRARARRLHIRAGGGREELEGVSNGAFYETAPTTDAKLQAKPQDKSKTPAAADRDRLQVLFVLRPSDEPSPSLKAKNRPE